MYDQTKIDFVADGEKTSAPLSIMASQAKFTLKNKARNMVQPAACQSKQNVKNPEKLTLVIVAYEKINVKNCSRWVGKWAFPTDSTWKRKS